MGDKTRTMGLVSGSRSRHYSKLLRREHKLFAGIDIGSTSSDVVVLDKDGKVIHCDYKRTEGRPIETIRSQLQNLSNQVNFPDIVLTVATGSAGRFLANLLAIPFINEVSAQAAAIWHLYPSLEEMTVIEIGGQDSKLILLSKDQGQGRIRDFTLNTVCAAGTGSFLDQQAQRLGIDIENKFGQMALESKTVPRMAGRCSVFAKTDMIHLQQQATPSCDIIAGLCLALARNLKSNLGCGREFIKPIIFTGGVAANIGVVRALEQVFELRQDQLIIPDKHFFTGAIGAVLVARTRSSPKDNGRLDLEKIDSYLARRGSVLAGAPRQGVLNRPALPQSESAVYGHLLSNAIKPVNSYLGLDVGSISTNVVVIDEQKRILAKEYLMTAGRPLEAVRKGLGMIAGKVGEKVKILGAATTGSGRYLTGDFIGADVVINEISAQAAGAVIVNPKVDTIFEIGGQDSKYISLENGVVVDFEMNHACAAGTGSFLEEQAQRLCINIDEEFAETAFQSKAPIKLGERCTVFMESDLLNYQQQGAKTEDLVSGLSYSIVDNYLNRVVGRRKIGDNICFQGGTAFNKAVRSAFEKVTGKPIMVPDHHEVTGALGAAAIVSEYMEKKADECGQRVESNFRGFEHLVSIKYNIESFTCEHCPNHCDIKKVQLPEAQPLFYGSRCDRYNIKKKSDKTESFCAFKFRHTKLLEFAGLNDDQKPGKIKAMIGIPMCLVNWQLLPLFARFFKSLGYEVVLSGQTNKKIIRIGVESTTAQLCFPVKVAYGHVAELIKKEVDFIFLPSIVSMIAGHPQNRHNQLCPYVQSIAYQVKTAFAGRLGKTKILTVPIHMGEGKRLFRKSFISLGKKLKVSKSAVCKAIEEALFAQHGFEEVLKKKGREILGKIGPDQKLFVLVSRPYNGGDEGLNLQLPMKLSELGVETIPMDMLDLDDAEVCDEPLQRQIYWAYGQKILRAADVIKKDPRLFAIYLSNFSCGPDSFLMTFFKDIMAQNPCLQLELDEHSTDAGVITRLEAFLDSLKHYRCNKDRDTSTFKKPTAAKTINRKHTLYIPYMGDCAYGVAACIRAYGQSAEVMPIADELSLLQGRQVTTGKECLPCIITTGDMLKVVRAKGAEPDNVAFFMPGSAGPCRFGMYNCLHRLILGYVGMGHVPVISPDQDGSFYKEFSKNITGSVNSNLMKDVWIATVGIDLLWKLLLRLRPFAVDARQAQQVYEHSVKRWVQAVEKRMSLTQMHLLMNFIANDFAEVELDLKVRKPRIGIVGEIYVRSHPFANRDIITRLEELGAACDLATLAEWIYYTNFTRNETARRRKQTYEFFNNKFQNYFQHKIEKKLAGPLEKRFGKLAEGPIEHIIEMARPYMHHSFEGEAILSIGKMIEFYRRGIGGVVNVMPFSCMPSTIVSTQTRRISSECDNMPILNLSFDGQEDSTLVTRLEAFVEQVCQKKDANLTIPELVKLAVS
ncbi:MAG: acyl-CoA dehydratase activase [Planctomycetota bacterium]